MPDVFLSYRKEDFPIAERVVNGLKAQGLSVWWDESLTTRSAWDAELEGEIAAAATVVVLWTPLSVDSEWVRIEAHYALEHGKLIPVMMEPCSIPLAFSLRQTVNLSDWHAEVEHRHWRKLLAWIVDLAAAKAGSTAPRSAGTAPANAFRTAVDHLASGEPVVDGTFVNASSPAGTAFRDGDSLPIVRIVPAGAFLIGSSATDPDRSVVEGPQKRIEIPLPFAIGVFPVLVAEYAAAVHARPPAESPAAPSRGWAGMFKDKPARSSPVTGTLSPKLPMTNVSFQDANALLTSLSATSGETYRLPSETEWEYACRAGSRSRYSFGDSIDATMAAFGRSAGPVAPGSFHANAFGLYDMHGNVREWTADLWHESYESTPLDGSPALEGHGSMRVVRGGGWSDSAPMLRSAARMRATESIRSNVIGFRVVRLLG
jgi:formylglycine-generating enzyme required for sulfatase activity